MIIDPGRAEQPRVTFLTREGCHLCDNAMVVLHRVCNDLGVDYAVVDIDQPGNESVRAEYTDQVPVTFVDGERFDFWRIDEGRLRAALK